MRPARSAVAARAVQSAAPGTTRASAEEEFLVLPEPVLEVESGLEPEPVPVGELLPETVTTPEISVTEYSINGNEHVRGGTYIGRMWVGNSLSLRTAA